jgi:peptide/nickel transport system substrate-binding protein
VPDLASSWVASTNGRTWTFHLRPDATWHDGQPVTADDVVFTVGVTQRSDYAGPLAGAWKGVSATKVGPLDVRFNLGAPVADFPLAAASPILPSHVLAGLSTAQLAAASFGRDPVGAGPFRLLSLTPDGALLLRTSGAGTGIDQVRFRFFAPPKSK